MIIFGIETSCDETSAAVVKINRNHFFVLSNVVSSQIKIHQPYGGVVPELAARNHIKNILPVINQALIEAKIKPNQVDKIAVTVGPGLITSLLIGVQTAKILAYTWQKPIAGINHMVAHIYANWLNNKLIKFPAIALIVSGGHTELVLIKNKNNFKKVGQTLDDAAGEAFDKVAQLLNVGYPGGPIISRLAERGDINAFNFPRPMIEKDNFNFSFSGLKTAVLYTIKDLPKKLSDKQLADLSASFQQAVVETLVAKTIKAAEHFKAKTVILAGGVAANKLLREQLGKKVKGLKRDFLMPDFSFCTDNAAMIAAAGYFTKNTPWQKLRVDPNLEIK
ncbi:MAG: tRNA (adenosine(37)-N6)-threonylcarbamoyltransferase complex transferase subunit TsaD [Candidatus Buchananbacteria bacterium RIFCSPHIGHO2_02_FULL_38_8]|uniref:tRNA N6-adenosine threonylcarbamoyltransferase n=2 Tax=Candidatus Buchananiibacteriota TaxID=1817903 RepID=A0A1G1XUQ4_9BACT|nr:MAG: tRNA (adenosine(37)-N6)-threonylcarbamoyltransferase complex transferase subunit TsaD [Candidatus Buchananbacteria bacterium RIFCSPHIGHO2_01_FULL_39_8]OGY47177.1 MAG: tRNA (adenosine(37)-N6)-threonylcarbamoyltransferase complex transferase subunit TsaD [Candidatus Buchananbacteria bacterium RIFCSPHIGHO2_02_FULL_38_8]